MPTLTPLATRVGVHIAEDTDYYLSPVGDEEIVAEIGGATPGDSHPLRLFENPGHRNDLIALRLARSQTNTPGIGARITLPV